MDEPKTINEYQDQVCAVLKCPPRQKYDPDIPTMNQLAPLWAIAFELHRIGNKLGEIEEQLGSGARGM